VFWSCQTAYASTSHRKFAIWHYIGSQWTEVNRSVELDD